MTDPTPVAAADEQVLITRTRPTSRSTSCASS